MAISMDMIYYGKLVEDVLWFQLISPLDKIATVIFKWIFLNEMFCVLIKISYSKGPIDNNPALV